MPKYDYIIIGAGASGLLLAEALANDSFFTKHSILLIDKENKTQNDRTWCFWEQGDGDFDLITHRSWSNIHFAGQQMDLKQSITPYRYKMLRGIDFYNHYLEKIKKCPNINFVQDTVLSLSESESIVQIKGQNSSYTSHYVFDSRFAYTELIATSKYSVLQQHFLGWHIKTDRSVFDGSTASFMDFSIPQKGNTRFMYVLPFSENEALVEYTLFSEHPLQKKEYEEAIKDYLRTQLDIESYEILAVEKGNIPMSCFDFAKANTNHVFKIGIAGGWAKPSTGYTFYRSTKKVKELVAALKKGKPLSKFDQKTRFWFYDLLLLDILHRDNHLGSKIFEAMFRKRTPQQIFKFLDEDSSLWEELKIIWACPKWPFVKALFKRIL